MKSSDVFKEIYQKIESFKQKYPVKLSIILIGILLTFIEFFNGMYDVRNNLFLKKNELYLVKPAFNALHSSDSINILITRFEDYYMPDKDNCVGKAINYRIRQIAYKKELPINVLYIDSIESPVTPDEAKVIANKNNSDLIIYGKFRSMNDRCGEGKICFKTAANNFLEATADSNNISINKEAETYINIQPDQIETGEFSLDTVSFDSWIQSLYVLKKRSSVFDKYIALYRINSPSNNDVFRMYKFQERAKLNSAIGNHYDAISDFDSAYVISQNLITRFANQSISHLRTYDSFVKFNMMIQALEKDSYKMLYNELAAYTNINQPRKALELLERKIDQEQLKKSIRDEVKANSLNMHKLQFNKDKVVLDSNNKNLSLKNYKLYGFYDSSVLADLYLIKSYILLRDFEEVVESEKALKKSIGARDINVYYGNAIMLCIYKKDVNGLKYYYNDAISKSYSLLPMIKLVRDNFIIENMVSDDYKIKYFHYMNLIVLFMWLDSIFFSFALHLKFVKNIKANIIHFFAHE